jgi:hypothetical protein
MDRAKAMKPRKLAGRLGTALAGPVLLASGLAACGSLHATTTGTTGAASAAPSTASVSPSATPASGAPGSGALGPRALGPGALGPGALCQVTGTLTGLQIVRVGLIAPRPRQVVVPAKAAVGSPAEVRAVARALCALPVMPKAVFHCPAEFTGTTYRLNFTAGGQRLRPVEIQATGCETVTGLGPARWAAESPGFWPVLARAAGISPPGQSAFNGVPAGTPCQPPSTQLHQINGCPGLARPGSVARPGGTAKPAG